MRTGAMVVAMTMSGAIGGALGAILVQGIGSPAAPVSGGGASAASAATQDPALEKEFASLRARLDEMQASLNASVEESGKVRKDLDEGRKAAAAAQAKIAALEASGAARDAGAAFPPGMPQVGWTEAGGTGLRTALAGGVVGLPESLRKSMELRQKSEEDRWTAAREALGLVPSQEEELKAAIKERSEAIRDAVLKMETRDLKGGDGNGTQISFSMPDPEKMREAKRRYDDRVNATLNGEQAKKWREDGYEQALGASPMAFTMATFKTDAVPAEK